MCDLGAMPTRVGRAVEERSVLQTYIYNQGTSLKSIKMLSTQIMLPDNSTASPWAASAPIPVQSGAWQPSPALVPPTEALVISLIRLPEMFVCRV